MAIEKLNILTPSNVKNQLFNELPFEETSKYLYNVLKYMREYESI